MPLGFEFRLTNSPRSRRARCFSQSISHPHSEQPAQILQLRTCVVSCELQKQMEKYLDVSGVTEAGILRVHAANTLYVTSVRSWSALSCVDEADMARE